VHVTEEDEYFPPPRELRELMNALDVAAPALFGGPLPSAKTAAGSRDGAFTDDRRVDASDVLAG
jgi:4-hydroxy-3-methylbut-2-enyl diphosphate reductase